MNLVQFTCLTIAALALGRAPLAFAAAANPDPGSEIAALEKKLALARDETNELKTALAVARAQAQAAETRAQARTQPSAELASLRSQVLLLERDLQSATMALKKVASEKLATEAALAETKQQLAGGGPEHQARRTDESAELRAELAQARMRLVTAEKEREEREAELTQLRASLVAAESRAAAPAEDIKALRGDLEDTKKRLAAVTEELTGAQEKLARARQLEERVRQLEAENTTLGRSTETVVSREEFARVEAALAEAERKLAAATEAHARLAQESEKLRTQAGQARMLEARISQMESSASKSSGAAGESAVSKEEFDRIAAAKADAEGKLATALRSFTLVTKERDELRARVAELSARLSDGQQGR